ncbi:MAG: hypothetical protein HFK10_05005 [Clostridia bacterium]|jgi:septum formation topological specificity factor MinE|nr:hypothetical protein [Clostridia bacterium]
MNEVKEKLKNAVITDRAGMMENTLRVVKSDVYGILSNYMELGGEDVAVTADLDERGACLITVTAKTRTFYEIGKLIKN